jgi:hypothetical protein
MDLKNLLNLAYTSIIIIINVFYFLIFGYVVKDIGFLPANGLFFKGAFSLLIFNSVTFLVSLLLFKTASYGLKKYNNVLFTVLLIASFIPILLTIV